jgi:hypothetical protein
MTSGDGGATGGSDSTGGTGGGSSATLEATPDAPGSVQLGGAVLEVPAGAVQTATTLTLEQLELDPEDLAELPEGLAPASPAFAFLPHGISFSVPVTITLPHDGSAPAPLVSVWRLDDEEDTTWESVPLTSTTASTVTFQVTGFSIFVVADGGAEVLHTASGTHRLGHLAMNSERIFYVIDHPGHTRTTEIGSVNLDGSDPAHLLPLTVADAVYSPAINAITATDSTVYYMHGADLRAIPVSGGSPTTLTTVPAEPLPNFLNGVPRLLHDGAQLYLLLHGSSDASNTLRSLSFAGVQQGLIGGDGTLLGPRTLTLDGGHLLYAAGDVLRIPTTLALASQTTVAASSEFADFAVIVGLAQDAEFVYVLTNNTAPSRVTRLYRKARAGGEVASVIAPLNGFGRGLRLIGGHLYFMNELFDPGTGQTQATLQRVPAGATNATPAVLTASGNAFDLLSDGTFLYFGDGTSLMRLRLP